MSLPVRVSAYAIALTFSVLISAVCSGNSGTAAPKDLQTITQALVQRSLAFSATGHSVVFKSQNIQRGYSSVITGGTLTVADHCNDWQVISQLHSVRKDNRSLDLEHFDSENSGQEIAFCNQDLEVQYVHSVQGLRQNFVIYKAPAGSGPLTTELILHSTITPNLQNESSLVYVDHHGAARMSYSDLLVWDAEGAVLSARMELQCKAGRDILQLIVDDRNAKYPITIDPISTTPDRLLIGSQNAAEFGYSVASAGDLNADGYSDVVVGAWKASSGQAGEGLAFVYYGSSTGISAVADLVLEVDQAGAEFGCSVSTAGDVNGDGYADLVVGARRWENSATTNAEGAAFIYHGSPTGINPVYDEMVESNTANAFMGSNVACAGDIDDDGFSDLIIGAYLAQYPSYQEGAAFIYRGSATGLTLRHRLEGNHNGAHFSRSVSSAGDINGDGFSDIIIGSSLYDNLGSNDGRAFVYYGSAGGLSNGAFSAPPDASLSGSGITSSQFGWSVTCAGDINGDGYSDVAVGSYRDANGQSAEGRIHVFHGSAAGIITTAAIILESNQANAWMGRSCSGVGDMNGDGYGDLAVGIPLYDQGQQDEGVVFIYLGSPTGLPATRSFIIQLNNAGANLGSSINSAGDVNGDGFSDLIVGANIYGSGGAAAIFHGGAYGAEVQPSTEIDGGAALDHLGSCVSGAGDVNGDGLTDILVSAINGTSGQTNEGLVYSYLAGPAGFTNAPTLLQRNVANGGFGTSISTAGDVNGDGYADAIVGAPNISTGGAAYVYFGSPSGLPLTPNRILSGPIGGSLFGTSVSTAGDINSDGYADVLVGAPGANTVYLFVGSGSGTVNAPTEVLAGPPGSQFGLSVSSAGDVNGDGYSDIVIGAPNAGNGLVRVYHGAELGLNTTPAIEINSSFPAAEFGTAVSAAGDVDADGFFDIAIGSPGYSNGQVEEGALHIYYGSTNGITTVGPSIMQRNQAGARLGTSVSEAGDVNGDGYADVIVGAPFMEIPASQTDEGLAYVYEGRSTGLTAQFARVLQTNIAGAELGTSVSGAGDVDGDGYSDVVLGAPKISPSFTEQGGFKIFKGNNGIGKERLARQYQADLVSPLATNSMDFSDPNNFGIGLYSNHYSQRMDGRLHWEIAFEGNPFNGIPITNAVVGSDTSTTWTDLGPDGVEIKELILKKPGFIRYKWRVRIEYELAKSYDGQRFSKWYYGFSGGHSDIGVLPVELIAFQGNAEDVANHLQWLVGSEVNVDKYDMLRSADPSDMRFIGSIDAVGNSVNALNYSFDDMNPIPGVSYYQLRMVDSDGTTALSPVISILRAQDTGILYPNPTIGQLHYSGTLAGMNRVLVHDATGRLVIDRSFNEDAGSAALNLTGLTPGTYQVSIWNADRVVYQEGILLN